MDRIDTITNALELRGFGKNKKRTWYSARKMQKLDWIIIFALIIFLVISILITFSDGSRFYNPFI